MVQPPNPGPAWAPQGPPRRRNGPSPFIWVLIMVSGLITIFVALRLLAFGTADAPKKETVDHGRFAKAPNGCAALTGEDVYGRDGSLDEFASQDRARPGVLDTGTHLAAHLSAM
jgi:hypothetical protein